MAIKLSITDYLITDGPVILNIFQIINETTSWNDMDSLLYLKPFNDNDFLEELRVYSSRTRPIQVCSFRLE